MAWVTSFLKFYFLFLQHQLRNETRYFPASCLVCLSHSDKLNDKQIQPGARNSHPEQHDILLY